MEMEARPTAKKKWRKVKKGVDKSGAGWYSIWAPHERALKQVEKWEETERKLDGLRAGLEKSAWQSEERVVNWMSSLGRAEVVEKGLKSSDSRLKTLKKLEKSSWQTRKSVVE